MLLRNHRPPIWRVSYKIAERSPRSLADKMQGTCTLLKDQTLTKTRTLVFLTSAPFLPCEKLAWHGQRYPAARTFFRKRGQGAHPHTSNLTTETEPDPFSRRFRKGISFPNFVERSILKLPLSELCAVSLALQDRALFEGQKRAKRCWEKGRKRGGQQRGQKGKKKDAWKQVRNGIWDFKSPHMLSAFGCIYMLLCLDFESLFRELEACVCACLLSFGCICKEPLS